MMNGLIRESWRMESLNLEQETENRPLSLKAVKRQYFVSIGEKLSLICLYPDNIMAENRKISKILL